jgi:diguanylate cyclase (GGDEF)-like protein
VNRITRPLSTGLRAKLVAMCTFVLLALVGLSIQAWQSSRWQQAAQERQVKLATALHLSKQADMLHDALRADVLMALLVDQVQGLSQAHADERVQQDARDFLSALRDLQQIELPPALRSSVADTQHAAESYAAMSKDLVALAARDRNAAIAGLVTYEEHFKIVYHALDEQGHALSGALHQAQTEASEEADSARNSLVAVCTATTAIALFFIIGLSNAVRRLRHIGEVALAVADGDLARRVGGSSRDELAGLGHSIDRMAENLSQTIYSMRDEAERSAFGKRLSEALDMADREAQVNDVAARAMAHISATHQMELLISDSSKAHLERASEHPTAGAPGCRVGSPYDCVAVRRGTVVQFESSEALNACAHLRGRACGSVSAVCVPVSFMGRSIGVLHAAAGTDQPLSADQAQHLAMLGTQIGMRVGTVRAFEATQIQASTDSLTGLANRRTLEHQLHKLCGAEGDFSFVMCDLDHFKMLNDTHGHAAGDTALRIFSDVLRQSLRESDLVGRWGGEEFAFILQRLQAPAARELVDRLRSSLATALKLGKAPPFTASFGIADSTMTRRPEDLVRLADVALYQAKAEGRDRARVGNPSMAFGAAGIQAVHRVHDSAAAVDVQALALDHA